MLAKASGCAWCGGGSQPFVLDADGDLVCAPGRGCSRTRGQRAAPVARTRVERVPAKRAPAVVPQPPRVRTTEHCACGRVEGDPGVWLELIGRTLLVSCPGCAEVL